MAYKQSGFPMHAGVSPMKSRKKNKATKKKKKEFKKNTVVVNGKTYDKKSNVKTEDYSDYTVEELMKRKEDPNYRKTR